MVLLVREVHIPETRNADAYVGIDKILEYYNTISRAGVHTSLVTSAHLRSVYDGAVLLIHSGPHF